MVLSIKGYTPINYANVHFSANDDKRGLAYRQEYLDFMFDSPFEYPFEVLDMLPGVEFSRIFYTPTMKNLEGLSDLFSSYYYTKDELYYYSKSQKKGEKINVSQDTLSEIRQFFDKSTSRSRLSTDELLFLASKTGHTPPKTDCLLLEKNKFYCLLHKDTDAHAYRLTLYINNRIISFTMMKDEWNKMSSGKALTAANVLEQKNRLICQLIDNDDITAPPLHVNHYFRQIVSTRRKLSPLEEAYLPIVEEVNALMVKVRQAYFVAKESGDMQAMFELEQVVGRVDDLVDLYKEKDKSACGAQQFNQNLDELARLAQNLSMHSSSLWRDIGKALMVIGVLTVITFVLIPSVPAFASVFATALNSIGLLGISTMIASGLGITGVSAGTAGAGMVGGMVGLGMGVSGLYCVTEDPKPVASAISTLLLKLKPVSSPKLESESKVLGEDDTDFEKLLDNLEIVKPHLKQFLTNEFIAQNQKSIYSHQFYWQLKLAKARYDKNEDKENRQVVLLTDLARMAGILLLCYNYKQYEVVVSQSHTEDSQWLVQPGNSKEVKCAEFSNYLCVRANDPYFTLGVKPDVNQDVLVKAFFQYKNKTHPELSINHKPAPGSYPGLRFHTVRTAQSENPVGEKTFNSMQNSI